MLVGFRSVRQVSDAFLLNTSEVSATLISLLLVGVFFNVEAGLRRLEHAREVAEPYLRAGTRIILILYGMSSASPWPWSPWSRSGPRCSSSC